MVAPEFDLKSIYQTVLKSVFTLMLVFLSVAGWGQVSVTALPYSKSDNFDTYNPTNAPNAASSIPTGWTHSGAVNYFGRSTGTGTGGGFYGFGNNPDYSIGALRSGANEYTYTVSFTNNSGSTINSITLAWNYEQWRYANTSGWNVTGTGQLATNTTLNGKDFNGVASGTNGVVTTTPVSSFTLTGLSIANGQSFGITWVTVDAAGSDNGLSIDDFSIAASTAKTSITSGIWSDPAIWSPLGVPTSADNAVIASGHVVTMDNATYSTRNAGTTTTVDTGGTLATNQTYVNNGTTTVNGSFQLDAGGWVSDAGGTNPLVYGANGTLIFDTAYGANNGNYWPTTDGPVNVTVNTGSNLNLGFNRTVPGVFQTSAGVTLTGATLTLNGTNRINTGGFFNNSPIYGSASTLVYNNGAAFGRGNEWTTATSGAGYPANVQISNPGTFTTVNMGATSAQCSGNLIIDASATLNTTSGGLTVLGNVTSNGTISLGGDVTTQGNWTIGASGTQTNNSKAVFFTASTGNQTITRTGGGVVNFDYLVVNKAAGNVQLSASPATSVTLNTAAGDVLQLSNAGALDLNGQTLTLNNNGGSIAANAAGRSITSGVTGATLAITGTKSFNGAGTLVINTNVTTVLSAGFDFGVNKVTVNGVLQLNGGGFATNGSAPTYAIGSTLLFNTGGNYDMHNGTADVAGWFRNVASTGSAPLDL